MQYIRPEPHQSEAHPLRCPAGHRGPWRHVEQIEVHRAVGNLCGRVLPVSGLYETGEGYDDGIPETAYLECRHELEPSGLCLERLPIPHDIDIEWVDAADLDPSR